MPKPQELRELALEEIEPNRSQPRQYFEEAALDALAGSIAPWRSWRRARAAAGG
jgi:hypothetical protein